MNSYLFVIFAILFVLLSSSTTNGVPVSVGAQVSKIKFNDIWIFLYMNSLLVYCAVKENAAALHGTGTLDTGLDEELHGLSHKRAIFDLFDFLGAGNSLCAAHCIP